MDTSNNQEDLFESKEELVIDSQSPNLNYGGFWMRFWAYLVDLIVIGSLNRILLHPFFTYFDLHPIIFGPFSLYSISTVVMFYIYFVFMTKFFAQTLGKMVFGLKVLEKDEKPLTWSTVLFREVIGRFISKTVFMIGYIVVSFTKEKQGWHDMLADTKVILDRR